MTPETKPDWWLANERDRASMDLPAYEPPRFADGVFVHEVVPEVESAHDCEIRFLGVNVSYPDDWEVRIDGQPAFSVGRTRNEQGNTVYRMDSDEFERRVVEALG